jgi:signal transduction histidine kinase
MHQLFGRVQQFREAFSRGVHEERKRVARDLHDDVGAKLLTLVYAAETEQHADLARETLQELRDVIRGLEQTNYTLVTTLAELRRETERRCIPHELEMKWSMPEPLVDQPLQSRQHSNLQRIVREAVTNALRHSDADRLHVTVRQREAELLIQISNDKVRGTDGAKESPGRGMRNISSRAQELGGVAEWHTGEGALLGGYTVEVRIPVSEGKENE